MCMQCVSGTAVTASVAATGVIAWLHTRGFTWLTAKRLKITTAVLLTLGVIAAGIQP